MWKSHYGKYVLYNEESESRNLQKTSRDCIFIFI